MAMTGPQASDNALQSVLDRLGRDEPAALERLFELSIPSVSTDPAFKSHCIDAAECCASQLHEIGFDAQGRADLRAIRWSSATGAGARPAAPARAVLRPLRRAAARSAGAVGHRPRSSRASSTTSADGKVIVARGAADDKGQLMTFVEAARAWKMLHGALSGAHVTC